MKRLAILLAVLAAVALLPSAASAGKLCDAMRSRLLRGGGAASGLLVVDVDSGRTVCARAPGRPRPLASNMKLFTTSTALSRFGPEYRIATGLLGEGDIDIKGVLHGSLYLRGAGDPALGDPAFYDRFLGGVGTDIYELVEGLREAGVRGVSGRLYADDSVFDRLRGVADSGYGTSPYIGPLSGLSFDSGYGDVSADSFASDPALTAAGALARALRAAGIAIHGVARATTPPGATALAAVDSPTMSQLVQATDVYSNNFFAEMLIKLLGANFGGAGTTRAGAGVVERFARSLGSGVQAVDGSGLTRSNRASPRQVVRLLLAMRASAVGEDLIGDLALTGHSGTVASRTRGTAAYGRCRTKTGTLTGVSNLSGFCFNRDGKTMAFSILMGSVYNLSEAHRQQDLIAAAVASY